MARDSSRHGSHGLDAEAIERARQQAHDRDAYDESTPARFRRQFMKTMYCRYWPNCRQGDTCDFAHSSDELRVRPNLNKTSLCKDWQAGHCALTSRACPFAHGYYEMRATEEFIKPKTKKRAGGKVGSCPSHSFNNHAAASTCRLSAQLPMNQEGQSWPAHGIDWMIDNVAHPNQCSTSHEEIHAVHDLPARGNRNEDDDAWAIEIETDGSTGATCFCNTITDTAFDMTGAYVVARWRL